MKLLFSRLFLLLGTLAVIGCSHTNPAPCVSVEPEFRDFGIVEAGQQIKHRFRITNGTNESVKILSIAPSCNCIHLTTESGDPDKPLGPGESVSISAQMEAGSISEVQKGAVKIVLRAGERVQKLSTWFTLRLPQDYTVSPTSIDFGTIPSNEKRTHLIKLESERDSLKFVEVYTSSEEVKATILSDRRVSVSVSSLRPPFRWDYQETVYLRTSSKVRPVVAVPVKWQPQWDYQLEPPVVVFVDANKWQKLHLKTFEPSLITDIRLPEGIAVANNAISQDQPRREHVLSFQISRKIDLENAEASISFSMGNRTYVVNVPLVSFLASKEEK